MRQGMWIANHWSSGHPAAQADCSNEFQNASGSSSDVILGMWIGGFPGISPPISLSAPNSPTVVGSVPGPPPIGPTYYVVGLWDAVRPIDVPQLSVAVEQPPPTSILLGTQVPQLRSPPCVVPDAQPSVSAARGVNLRFTSMLTSRFVSTSFIYFSSLHASSLLLQTPTCISRLPCFYPPPNVVMSPVLEGFWSSTW